MISDTRTESDDEICHNTSTFNTVVLYANIARELPNKNCIYLCVGCL